MADFESNEEKANKLKEEGNKFLKTFRYALAAEKYTEAIALCPTAILYSNRAQALIMLESYGLAIEDANEAIK
jgi:serine/threonine-protein phosphatase 5